MWPGGTGTGSQQREVERMECFAIWCVATMSCSANWTTSQPRPSHTAIRNRPGGFAFKNVQHILVACPPEANGFSCHKQGREYFLMTFVF
jgi:hypothetical protein